MGKQRSVCQYPDEVLLVDLPRDFRILTHFDFDCCAYVSSVQIESEKVLIAVACSLLVRQRIVRTASDQTLHNTVIKS